MRASPYSRTAAAQLVRPTDTTTLQQAAQTYALAGIPAACSSNIQGPVSCLIGQELSSRGRISRDLARKPVPRAHIIDKIRDRHNATSSISTRTLPTAPGTGRPRLPLANMTPHADGPGAAGGSANVCLGGRRANQVQAAGTRRQVMSSSVAATSEREMSAYFREDGCVCVCMWKRPGCVCVCGWGCGCESDAT